MIKALESKDIPDLHRIILERGDHLFSNLPVITQENLAGELLRTAPGTGAVCFCIMDDGRVAGFMTLNNIDRLKNSAFIGNIAVKKGTPSLLGLKAAKWLINYCFDTLNLNRVYGHTWADNERMDAFYRRLGAVHEGTEREHTYKQGKYVDLKIWGILRREWKWRE